jgi:glucokinase
MIKALFVSAELALKDNGIKKDELNGIGISCGEMLNSRKEFVLSPPDLPGWNNIAIVEMAEKKFGIKTNLQNDANACALAEWEFGAGKGYSNIIFLTFDKGLGAQVFETLCSGDLRQNRMSTFI